MSDDLSHRLSSIADEMERAARGKSVEDLHELFARACLVMREAAGRALPPHLPERGRVRRRALPKIVTSPSGRQAFPVVSEIFDGEQWVRADSEAGQRLMEELAGG